MSPEFMKINFLISILIFAFIGCASANKSLPPGLKARTLINFSTNTLRDTNIWAQGNLQKLEIYIGRPKEDLKKDFGEPSLIKKNIPHKEKQYDEWWRYWYSKGMPMILEESWAYDFYINNGIVEYVEVK